MNASPSAQPGAAPPQAQPYICLDPNLGSDASVPLRQAVLDVLPAGHSFPRPPDIVRVDGSLVENLGAELEALGSRLVVERPSARLREWIRLTGAALPVQAVSGPGEIEER